jgi:iron complex transport system ATP-binding protein
MQVKQLTYIYPNQNRGVKQLNFTITPGTMTAVIGPNGSGKSTLFKLLARELTPTSGTIELDQQTITDFSAKAYARKVAVVHQRNLLYDDISVLDLVRFGQLPYHSLLAEPDDVAIKPILDYLELTPLQQQSMAELSGGQQQRVWLALALAQQPEYLLLDEPTTYLDLHFQASFMELLAKLNREMHLTIVMILHDLNQARHFSQQVLMLADGAIVAAGTPQAVITPARLREVFQINTELITTTQGEFIVQLPNKPTAN